MADEEWDRFFTENPAPNNYAECEGKLRSFCDVHSGRGVVLVTSGGTTVPLELNTVRYVDNFSAGTRGATSAEYFLRNGYAVIFLHRENSLEPFARFLPGSKMLQWLSVSPEGRVQVSDEQNSFVREIVQEYQKYSENLCKVTFTSLSDYLWILRLAAQVLNNHKRAILYLAAAVSDFYVPSQQLPEHKLQSSEGPPAIKLTIVPKMLRPLVGKWAQNCFVVSFKLETNPEILSFKAKQALERYGHNIVIGNILQTRKREVWILTQDEQRRIEMNQEELDRGEEIEQKIIKDILDSAAKFFEK